MGVRFTDWLRGRGRKTKRACGSIDIANVTQISPLDAVAGEYEVPSVKEFAAQMMNAADELVAAGSLDAGNGQALDARIDMELERVCARLDRQYAENEVMLDRIEAALQARLREIEVRDADVTERLNGARNKATELHNAEGLAQAKKERAKDGRSHARYVDIAGDAAASAGQRVGSEGDDHAQISASVVRLAPRYEEGSGSELKEASNA